MWTCVEGVSNLLDAYSTVGMQNLAKHAIHAFVSSARWAFRTGLVDLLALLERLPGYDIENAVVLEDLLKHLECFGCMLSKLHAKLGGVSLFN